MRESVIERYLVRQVKNILHGQAKKLHNRNDPDRLVLLPHGLMYFVETKAPGKKPRPGQTREFARLEALGFPVRVLDTYEAVDDFIRFRGGLISYMYGKGGLA